MATDRIVRKDLDGPRRRADAYQVGCRSNAVLNERLGGVSEIVNRHRTRDGDAVGRTSRVGSSKCEGFRDGGVGCIQLHISVRRDNAILDVGARCVGQEVLRVANRERECSLRFLGLRGLLLQFGGLRTGHCEYTHKAIVGRQDIDLAASVDKASCSQRRRSRDASSDEGLRVSLNIIQRNRAGNTDLFRRHHGTSDGDEIAVIVGDHQHISVNADAGTPVDARRGMVVDRIVDKRPYQTKVASRAFGQSNSDCQDTALGIDLKRLGLENDSFLNVGDHVALVGKELEGKSYGASGPGFLPFHWVLFVGVAEVEFLSELALGVFIDGFLDRSKKRNAIGDESSADIDGLIDAVRRDRHVL